MWDDNPSTAPAPVSSGSIFDSLQQAVSGAVQSAGQAAQRAIAGSVTGQATDPKLGIAEGSGKPFVAGQATFLGAKVLGVPAPLVLVGVGILALVLLHRA